MNRKSKTLLNIFLAMIVIALGFFANTQYVKAGDECENDVCLETKAGYVCADHSQVPGSEDGKNCDVVDGGKNCNPTEC